nr:MAG TPA: hypothetical protein [Caudoviricetes sp.]
MQFKDLNLTMLLLIKNEEIKLKSEVHYVIYIL